MRVYLGDFEVNFWVDDRRRFSVGRSEIDLPFIEGDFPMSGELLIEQNLGTQAFPLDCPNAIWHILQTRIRAEKALSFELSAMGLANVLPVICQERYFGRRRAVVEVPIFPGVVFLEGSEADLELACQTMRVLQTIKVADQESLSWTLRNLLHLAQRSVELTACAPVSCSRRFEVASGPLRGIQGLAGDSYDRLVFHAGDLAAAVGVKLNGQTLAPVA